MPLILLSRLDLSPRPGSKKPPGDGGHRLAGPRGGGFEIAVRLFIERNDDPFIVCHIHIIPHFVKMYNPKITKQTNERQLPGPCAEQTKGNEGAIPGPLILVMF